MRVEYKKDFYLFTLLFLITFLCYNTKVHVKAEPEVNIVDTYVARERVNVGEITYIGFQILWNSDNSPLQAGKVYFNERAGLCYTNYQGWVFLPVYTNIVENRSWSINKILYGDTLLDFHQEILDPWVVSDKVLIDLDTSASRIGVHIRAPISWTARYACARAQYGYG